jgi:hypothetical protein
VFIIRLKSKFHEQLQYNKVGANEFQRDPNPCTAAKTYIRSNERRGRVITPDSYSGGLSSNLGSESNYTEFFVVFLGISRQIPGSHL